MATGWVVISLAVAVLIGIIGLAMTAAGELIPLEGSASETIIVKIADLMSQHGVLPALLAGTILAGILAPPCQRPIHSYLLLLPPFLQTFWEIF